MASSSYYKALPFLQALVRIVDKSPKGLTLVEIDELYAALITAGIPRLVQEIPQNSFGRKDAAATNYMVHFLK